ncbi:MAG TPA: hypothetical protein VKT75_06255 [Acidobacteriaceae bacterium]|nr:hypothetical protein [Acidobacteriaceae bacterium]
MSAAVAFGCVLETTRAVAESALPVWRPRPTDGLAFYRKHTIALLRRYMAISMELGRTPCVMGTIVFRGRVSSYRIRSFEDLVIFIFDVEKYLKRLDTISQAAIAHIALEDFTYEEAAKMAGTSRASMARIYGTALDRLTQWFLECGLLQPQLKIGSARDE